MGHEKFTIPPNEDDTEKEAKNVEGIGGDTPEGFEEEPVSEEVKNAQGELAKQVEKVKDELENLGDVEGTPESHFGEKVQEKMRTLQEFLQKPENQVALMMSGTVAVVGIIDELSSGRLQSGDYRGATISIVIAGIAGLLGKNLTSENPNPKVVAGINKLRSFAHFGKPSALDEHREDGEE